MRIALSCVVVLAACGGKLAAEGDGGPTDASGADVFKKDASPPKDSGPDVSPPSVAIDVSSTGSGYESEDQIAVAPDGTIAIMWQALLQAPPYVAMLYKFSTDDGKTFSSPQPVIAPPGLAPGDPALAVDANSNFYASYLGIKYSGQSLTYSRVYVAEAPKGSMTFGAPVEISTPDNSTDLNDHPKIFVTKKNTLLVGWADLPSFTSATATGIVARSTDGKVWTRDTVVGPPSSTFGTFFWFCEGASAVYTTFLEATTTAYFVGARSSLDDGATFTTTSTQVSLGNEQIAGLDPSCAASGSDVWVMYTTTQNPSVNASTLDGADHIWVAHSGDGAATFDLTRPDALDHKADALATIPLLAQDSSGKLDVAYIAGAAAGDANGSVRFTRVSGQTVSASQIVDGPMLFDLSRTTTTWLGDYFGGVAHGGAFYLAYPRNESGYDHIFFQKVALP